MNNEHYLIHKEDYIKHINDKVFLYSMVKQLTHMVSKLAPNRGNKALSEMAECYNGLVERNFRTWGIPTAYLAFDNEALHFLHRISRFSHPTSDSVRMER